MKSKEVHDFSDDELGVKERELVESLTVLRLRARTNQVENPARLGQLRRDIARIKTERRARAIQKQG